MLNSPTAHPGPARLQQARSARTLLLVVTTWQTSTCPLYAEDGDIILTRDKKLSFLVTLAEASGKVKTLTTDQINSPPSHRSGLRV